MSRYSDSQRERTIIHPRLPQRKEDNDSGFSFVVASDTQIGMTSGNKEWETELEYSREAIRMINKMDPRPVFCCMCGDLVDMEHTFFTGKGFTREECDEIQEKQNKAFKETWAALHEDIAMVCLCGNHDIGNRPTKASIDKFTDTFGDDYLSFWVKNTYNIVLNTTLISDPSGAQELNRQQLEWFQERLKYAVENNAKSIFLFGHHPWFLYSEKEESEDLKGVCPYPKEWGPRDGGFPDYYFIIPKDKRMPIMDLCQNYGVRAAFSGHFHQNMVSKTTFGMDMIVTSSLSMVFESSGKPKGFDEPNTRGMRVVNVKPDGSFEHEFRSL